MASRKSSAQLRPPMKAFPVHFADSVAFSIMASFCPHSSAQTATAPNEDSRLTRGSAPSSYDFSWWGQPGRTYFMQHSDNLSAWEYLPLIESGAGAPLTRGFTSAASKFFLRLRKGSVRALCAECC